MDSIAGVQRQLESVLGSHLAVTAAAWAELMRTRADGALSLAAVPRIQHESGCRIHIERNAPQVQLFGPKNTCDLCQYLLAKLERMCIEEVVDINCPTDPQSLDELQDFAHDFGVTLQISEAHVTILGIKGAVIEAAKELRTYAFDSSHLDATTDCGTPSAAARFAIETAMCSLTVDSDERPTSTMGSSRFPVLQNISSMQSESLMHGAVTAKLPTSSLKGSSHQQLTHQQDPDLQQAINCQTCGGGSNYCVNCGGCTGKQGAVGGCPECGAANFCSFCGHPTEKNMKKGNYAIQHRVSEGAPYAYETSKFCGDPMPMNMIPVKPTLQSTAQPTVHQVVSGPTSCASQMLVPVAMCYSYDGSAQQYFPLYAGG
jgi:hypothetical protein